LVRLAPRGSTKAPTSRLAANERVQKWCRVSPSRFVKPCDYKVFRGGRETGARELSLRTHGQRVSAGPCFRAASTAAHLHTKAGGRRSVTVRLASPRKRAFSTSLRSNRSDAPISRSWRCAPC